MHSENQTNNLDVPDGNRQSGAQHKKWEITLLYRNAVSIDERELLRASTIFGGRRIAPQKRVVRKQID